MPQRGRKNTNALLLVVVLLCSSVSGAAQGEFNREQLSPKGKTAYEMLLSTTIFRVGPVGIAATTSEEELALYDLLDERQGIEAFKALVITGSYEGGLYGLLGLSLSDHREFKKAVKIYKARKAQPQRPSTGSSKSLPAPGEVVGTQHGCIITMERTDKLVKKIQSGHFDMLIHAKYRPSN